MRDCKHYTTFEYVSPRKLVRVEKRVKPWTYKKSIFQSRLTTLFVLPLLPLTIGFTTPDPTIISPLSNKKIEAPIASPTPKANITVHPIKIKEPNNEIKDYIIKVFGKDSDKAFQLLQCENSKLNPDIVNTAGNHPEGSRDIGVFQINEYWQQVQGKFLFNYKINIEIAHQLYKENGNSFKLWTCGKKLGI